MTEDILPESTSELKWLKQALIAARESMIPTGDVEPFASDLIKVEEKLELVNQLLEGKGE